MLPFGAMMFFKAKTQPTKEVTTELSIEDCHFAVCQGIGHPKEQPGFATSSDWDDLWQNDQQASQATWFLVSKVFNVGVTLLAPNSL